MYIDIDPSIHSTQNKMENRGNQHNLIGCYSISSGKHAWSWQENTSNSYLSTMRAPIGDYKILALSLYCLPSQNKENEGGKNKCTQCD